MQKQVAVQEVIAGIWLAYLLIKAANHLFMNTSNEAPPRLPTMQYHPLLTLHWRSFSGCGREHLSTCFLYTGCQYIRKWQCSTIVNIFQLTVGYLNATINGKSRYAEPEIGTYGSSLTWQNPWMDGYTTGFGPPRGSGSGFQTGLEPKQPIFIVRAQTFGWFPEPVVDTRPRPLQSVPNCRSHNLHRIRHRKPLVMGADQQSVQHPACGVPLEAESVWFAGESGVSQVHCHDVLVQ